MADRDARRFPRGKQVADRDARRFSRGKQVADRDAKRFAGEASESLNEMPDVSPAKQKAASKTLKRPAPYDGHPTPYWRRLGPMHRAGCSLGWRGSLSAEGSSESHEQCVVPQCELLVLHSYAVI